MLRARFRRKSDLARKEGKDGSSVTFPQTIESRRGVSADGNGKPVPENDDFVGDPAPC